MKAEESATGDLVVTSTETFIRVLFGGFAAGIAVVWLAPMPLEQEIAWTALCLIFGVALLAADERSRFVFQRERGVLAWRKDTMFRHESGEVPLSAITALSLERDFARSGQRGSARRLVVLTSQGPIPVTTAFSGLDRTQEPVGRAIQQFLNERLAGQAIQFITD